MKSILMILSCKKYAHKSQKQKDTWLTNITMPWFHIIGNPDLETEFEEDRINKIIYVKCKDTYEALPMKTFLGIKALHNLFPDIDYILKTDDDMDCNLENFNNILNLIPKYDYGGHIAYPRKFQINTHHYQYVEDEFKIPYIMTDIPYCAGHFYFLSMRCIQKIVHSRQWFSRHIFEDCAVGTLLNSTIPDLRTIHINVKSIFTCP